MIRTRNPATVYNERKLRGIADRQGYRLKKLRGQEAYWLIDVATGGLVIGEQIAPGVNVGCDLDTVNDWLFDRMMEQ
jgi:hypothetical protein